MMTMLSLMLTLATGPFDVKITPQADNRNSLDKQYHGDLEGTAKGEMLFAMTDVKDSGAYVAIEQVSGTLRGRKGTFMLQHSGTMTARRAAAVDHRRSRLRHRRARGTQREDEDSHRAGRQTFVRARIHAAVIVRLLGTLGLLRENSPHSNPSDHSVPRNRNGRTLGC